MITRRLNNFIQFDKTDAITGLTAFNSTKQMAFDQRDLHLTPEFEGAMVRPCQVLVSKLETLDTITFI